MPDIPQKVTCPLCKEKVTVQHGRWGSITMGYHSKLHELEGGLFIRITCTVGGEELMTAEKAKAEEAA